MNEEELQRAAAEALAASDPAYANLLAVQQAGAVPPAAGTTPFTTDYGQATADINPSATYAPPESQAPAQALVPASPALATQQIQERAAAEAAGVDTQQQALSQARAGQQAQRLAEGATPAHPLADLTAAPVRTTSGAESWRVVGNSVTDGAGHTFTSLSGDPNEIAAHALNAALGGQIGQEDYAAVLNLLTGAPGGGGAGGAGSTSVSIRSDLMSQVDPRALAQAALARAARVGGENAVRQSAAQLAATQAAGQMAGAGELEQATSQGLKEHEEAQNQIMDRVGRVDRVLQGLANASIDPDRFLNTGGNRIGAVIAVALGSLGALAGQPNQAMSIVNNAIARDISAQEAALRSGHATAQLASHGLDQFRAITHDDQAARDAYRAAYLQATQLRVGSLVTAATGEYRDRLMQLQQLLEQERVLAAQAIPQRIGQVTLAQRHTTAQQAQALINSARGGNAPSGPQAATGAPQSSQSAPTPQGAPSTPQEAFQGLEQALREGVNLPGLGRVLASPEVARLARRNPTAAAALHRQQTQGQAPAIRPMSRQEAQGFQQRGRQQLEARIPRFDTMATTPGQESVAAAAARDTESFRDLRDLDRGFSIIPQLVNQIHAMRDAIHAQPSNLGGLLASQEWRDVHGMMMQLHDIRQLTSHRGVRNVGDVQLLAEEMPMSRWSTGTIPGFDAWNDSVATTEATVRAWLRDMEARAQSMGYTPNTVHAQRREGEAQRNAASGRTGASIALSQAASELGGQPPRRGQ